MGEVSPRTGVELPCTLATGPYRDRAGEVCLDARHPPRRANSCRHECVFSGPVRFWALQLPLSSPDAFCSFSAGFAARLKLCQRQSEAQREEQEPPVAIGSTPRLRGPWPVFACQAVISLPAKLSCIWVISARSSFICGGGATTLSRLLPNRHTLRSLSPSRSLSFDCLAARSLARSVVSGLE